MTVPQTLDGVSTTISFDNFPTFLASNFEFLDLGFTGYETHDDNFDLAMWHALGYTDSTYGGAGEPPIISG